MSDFTPGEAVAVAPNVLRLTAPNPGVMTGPGTNSYLVGTKAVAVIDPGPADAGHVAALLAAAPGPIRWILVTHTHLDHSPAAALLREKSGAQLVGMPAPEHGAQDKKFKPGRIMIQDERLVGDDFVLTAIHTPGHASNHLCYLLEEEGLLFTGDHIMSGSTVVIAPPDGDMASYLASLALLKRYPLKRLAPAHGGILEQPAAVIDWLIAHRLGREAKVVEALAAAPDSTLDELLPVVYQDVQALLFPVAKHSLTAHLLKLKDEGRARRSDNGRWRNC
ncbi:MAG: MBL fold metallo-hydrolase [Pseudomonadales bacterium]|mgnify:FL=1|jgi:glyoxylase-like metal-dependent hydrolase (beta-lactamase superfamily II)|nr:MBL fold metallo-hydrolase [Pseudomonadales bacterium]MCP5333352.1 MBL fold metallo-hydrolase [Pseudomonadales bacterium]HMZ71134.1 MBL fold metallo-hydrolase [Pseudomonadales bacterium]